jgi:orotate phosphoribosyltransferase
MTLNRDQVLRLFEECGALLEGHFLLSSGLHSSRYLQSALVLQHPRFAEQLGVALAEAVRDDPQIAPVEVVIAPALGGIIVAHEVARALGVRALFTEREAGQMTLRRGFSLDEGERALVVEDVITTGGSTREVINVVARYGAVAAGAGSLIDRSGGRVELGVKSHSLAVLDVPTYQASACPLCRSGSIAIKPGSRK